MKCNVARQGCWELPTPDRGRLRSRDYVWHMGPPLPPRAKLRPRQRPPACDEGSARLAFNPARIAGVLFLLLGCQPPPNEGDAAPAGDAVAAGELDLVEVSLSWVDSLHPDVVTAPIALTEDGHLVLGGVLDATDRTRREFQQRLPTSREIERFAEELALNRGRPFYGPDGRPVDIGERPSEADRLLAYQRRILPHFDGLEGVWTDAGDRLWVVGQANDSTWLDLFDDHQFVRRWTFPCTGTDRVLRAAMGGGFFAFICEVDDPSGEIAARVKLYRIAGAGG